MQPNVQEGQVVISKQGRDQGKAMVVSKILDEKYILVINGDNHSIEKPKKKNIKHLQKNNLISDMLNKKFIAGEKPTDAEIRKELKRLVSVHNSQLGNA